MTARHSTLFTLGSGHSGLGFYTTQRDAAKSRSIPDRIVNVFQWQVPPIVRSKISAAVGSAAKISVSVQNGFAFLHWVS